MNICSTTSQVSLASISRAWFGVDLKCLRFLSNMLSSLTYILMLVGPNLNQQKGRRAVPEIVRDATDRFAPDLKLDRTRGVWTRSVGLWLYFGK